jgi:hypothetical protein
VVAAAAWKTDDDSTRVVLIMGYCTYEEKSFIITTLRTRVLGEGNGRTTGL